VIAAALDAKGIVKYAYDEDGRRLRGTNVRLLADAGITLRAGEIHALMGENGAGKTTLIKVLAGAVPHEEGTLRVHGAERRFESTGEARAEGISVIWQEFSLAPRLSVVENMFLGRELRRRGRLDKRTMLERAREALASLGVDIDPRTAVERLSTAQQQVVEIAKALTENARILILDEPTASLSRFEVERLFVLLRRLREEGIAIVLVTHRLDEAFSLSDRVTVLKDGRTVGERSTSDTTPEEIVRLMVGRELASHYVRPEVTPGRVVLATDDLRGPGWASEISIEVRAGEIVGLAGLVGAGRTELARAIVGADPIDAGRVVLDGEDVTGRPMPHRLAAGMAFVPEDRKTQGVILAASLQRNLAIAEWPRLGAGPFVSPRRERELSSRLAKGLRIVARSIGQPVYTLSGGNQQRVAIGKWLARDRSLYVLDEPTRGVDVAARQALYELMAKIVERGGAVLMISSDLPEVINMSDRIYVMRSGTVSAHLRRDEADEETVLAHMLPERAADDRVPA
jgi:ABC-type sugar transport system ATPase subunit